MRTAAQLLVILELLIVLVMTATVHRLHGRGRASGMMSAASGAMLRDAAR
jgi:hypothetical protein